MNAHLLLHLCDHVRHWGPVWGFSAFGFESMNEYSVQHIHATYRVADQLAFSLSLNETISSCHDRLLRTETTKTLQFLSVDTTNVNLGMELYEGSYVVGSMHSISPSLTERQQIELITLTECPSIVFTFESLPSRNNALFNPTWTLKIKINAKEYK